MARHLMIGLMLMLASIVPAVAATVSLEIRVNGDTSPLTVNVGDTIDVSIWAKVTDNTFSGVDLGLAGYSADIYTEGGYLQPVEDTDIFGNGNGFWDATFFPSGFTVALRGLVNVAGHTDDIIDHGAAVIDFSSYPTIAAGDWAMLATGQFLAVGSGTTAITFNQSNQSVNVIHYDGSSWSAVRADTILHNNGPEVTVVVPEPASLILAGLGAGVCLLWRRR